ncbi:hypothetical protein [Tamlana crocina]|uniref:Uncharacterized protein n=1 Tax=Tamlana crocina TaxID=393006 RepID=A0ABX1D693_9FLAO|nr:hypothetical protein [Tamlana crocina]NJX13883.1 hypothetical protein [Tamlana crocina]
MFLEGPYRASNGDFDSNTISALQISEGYNTEAFEQDDFSAYSIVPQTGDIICLDNLV